MDEIISIQESASQGEIGELLMRQETEKGNQTDSCLYWKVKGYGRKKLIGEFELYEVDNAHGRIGGQALFYHHRAGATVMVVSHDLPCHDVVKIVGTSPARESARSTMETLAKKVELPIIEVSQRER